MVIKGTKTIEEFKEVKARMEELAVEMSKKHCQACKDWKEGGITKVWFDKNSNLCIEYESGKWWHYNQNREWW